MKDIAKREVSFTLNHKPISLLVNPYKRLIDVLRDDLGLVGTKEGCAVGECGACTVILDGDAVTACLVLIGQVEGREVITIEGVADEDGTLDPIQAAILEHLAIQCGFCTPGFVMSAKALIDKNPHATLDEVRLAISGNLCRCTGYEQLSQAIFEAAQIRAKALAEQA